MARDCARTQGNQMWAWSEGLQTLKKTDLGPEEEETNGLNEVTGTVWK
jgi:hypothetical protein